jgi:hypothetical protein
VSEEYLGAMPKLYNAPAYARPSRAVVVDRPFDPDDLPLEANRSASDRAFLADVRGGPDGGAPEERSFLRRALLPFGRREARAVETAR